MNEYERLSDERLVSLHQQKRYNAFFILYRRYQNYGCAIVYRTLQTYQVINALKDNRESIIYESLTKAIASYRKERGTFRKLLAKIIERETINEINEFKKDPLSDYVSIDSELNESMNFRYGDSLTFADKEATPQDCLNLAETTKQIDMNHMGAYKRRIRKMIQLRKLGCSFKEIAKRCRTTEPSVRSIFYRLRIRIEKVNNSKKKSH